MARQWWRMVVVSPTGEWLEPRDVRGDLEYPDDFREALVQVAMRSSSWHTSGAIHTWIGEWEARVYDDHQAKVGWWPGGYGKPDKVLQFTE